ncbi:MAG: FeoB small GTPase domain-containing protein, partial [Gemmatimonadales bacterium]
MTTATAPCGGCTAGRTANLVQLGLQPDKWDYFVALAGNPNTGKSTVFNALTGLRQHTGNWPGKTVARAEGGFEHDGHRIKLVDLPGTYSLQAGSADEEVARDFVLFGQPDVTVIVVDATRLERNLNLVLQVLEITDRAIVCLNLMDEAKRNGIGIDVKKLADLLGVPVIPTSARKKEGIPELVRAIHEVATGTTEPTPFRIGRYPQEVESAVAELATQVIVTYPDLPNPRWVALRLLNADERVEQAVRTGDLGDLNESNLVPLSGNGSAPVMTGIGDNVLETASALRWKLSPNFHDALTESVYAEAQRIADESAVKGLKRAKFDFDRTLDRLLTSRWLGFPLMLMILAVVFWLTIAGANVPSKMIASFLIDTVHPALKGFAAAIAMPWWLDGFLFDGVYLATAWVVSVMLPPMAIFFPLFTLLEDFGYLPRVAFNLDKLFEKTGAHGKQALTM